MYRTVRDDGGERSRGRVLTYYDVLGVDPEADVDAIRQAWRVKVRLLHPDRHRGSPDDVQVEAVTETLRVNQAWETLRDPERRRQYDETISASRQRAFTDATLNRVTVTCGICNTTQQVPRNAGRFVCGNCLMAWQFAKCVGCNKISHVRERKNSWRCPSCNREQTSSWGGGSKYVHCLRCKTGNLTMPEAARFSCSQCRLVHVRCSCGQYSPIVGWQWRSWRCPKCRRLNPAAQRIPIDVAQVANLVVIALLGIVGLYLMIGLAR